MRIPLPPLLQRDAYFGNYGGTTTIQQNMKPLKITNYERLEGAQTAKGWKCLVSLEQPDSYRFGFYRDLTNDVACRVEMKLDREGRKLYDPYTFAVNEQYSLEIHYEGKWRYFVNIEKTDIAYKGNFLDKMEQVCEQYKEMALEDLYKKLPWYRKLIFKLYNFINKETCYSQLKITKS